MCGNVFHVVEGDQDRDPTGDDGLCGFQSLGSGDRMPGFRSLLFSILVTVCKSFFIYEMGIKVVPNSQGYCEDQCS